MIIAIDLDTSTYEHFSDDKSLYERFVPVEVDWPGGAGNVQIIGEYQARRLLTVDPSTIDSANWQNAFAYIVDTAALDVNPARLYFYVFSTGGGTGSGMCTEFGFAQQAAINLRQKESSQQEVGLERAPVFSCAVGVLPTIPDLNQVNEAIHLNSGRLLCKFLAMTERQVSDENAVLPWNCLVLVSNESVIGKLRESTDFEMSAEKFELVTNLYVAKHLFNLLAAQMTASDVPKHDWEAFGIGSGDRHRVDATDLLSSIHGLNAIAYSECDPRATEEKSLSSLFLRSFRATEVLTGDKKAVVSGISVLPGEAIDYENLFADDDDETARGLSEVPMFSRAQSTLSIVAVPEDFHLDVRDMAQIQTYCTEIFANAKIRRYALVRSVTGDLAVTTFISGNSVALSDECLALLLSYIRRCFSKSPDSEEAVVELILNAISTSLAPKSDKAVISKIWDDCHSELSTLLLETERLDEFTAPPFKTVAHPHEIAFQNASGASFIPIDSLAMNREDVFTALRAIARTLSYQQQRHPHRGVLSMQKTTAAKTRVDGKKTTKKKSKRSKPSKKKSERTK